MTDIPQCFIGRERRKNAPVRSIGFGRGFHIRRELRGQFRRHALRFFIKAGADVMRFGFENQFAVLVGDAMAEVHAHSLDEGRPDFNRQQVVVTGGDL